MPATRQRLARSFVLRVERIGPRCRYLLQDLATGERQHFTLLARLKQRLRAATAHRLR
jgi:hypothetical protein